MAKIVSVIFIVSAILKNGKIYTKSFEDFNSAANAYDNSKELDYPTRFSTKINNAEVTVAVHNWTIGCYQQMNEYEWKQSAAQLLKKAGLTQPQVDTVTSIDNKELRNTVFTNDLVKLCELKGIGMTTAKKIVKALREVSNPNPAPMGRSKKFIRVTLNNTPGKDLYTIDTISKTVSPFEAECLEVGGKDAVIHVVSRIDNNETDSEDLIIWRQNVLNKWLDIVENGIVVNGVRYFIFGHGTNGAKFCKEMAVRADIFDHMTTWKNMGMNPEWQNTAAKDIAYKVGLHSVYHHEINIPFQPEDFCIFKSIETETVANTTKLFLDGHAENKDNDKVPVARTDGMFMMHVSKKMKAVLFNRMVARGDKPEEAIQVLNEWMSETSFSSYRANRAALKGLGCKIFDFHERAKDLKLEKTPDGRDYDDIIFCVDDTVIKTAIGEGKAYPDFKAWCDDVRDGFAIGTVVHTHPRTKKDVSYQVTQSICEATDAMIANMAQKTVERLNKLHTVEGASIALGYEWGTIMKLHPELANVPAFAEQLENAITKQTNTAFSGKLLKDCYYAFVCPDPVFAFDNWNGIKSTGMLKAGQIHLPGVKYGKLGMWRSPVMHPNSVRVVMNVEIPKEFRKYILNEEYAIILNCIDDIPLAMDMDFDGDHGNATDDKAIIEAIEETLKKWSRLIIWETPKAQKTAIGQEKLQEYWKGLTTMNELGLTVYGLNALLNGIIREKDEITGYWTRKPVAVSHRGVDFKKFAANVLVDASKHGGATIEEPEESAQCSKMEQPWAKTYQDAVREKKFWYVKTSNGKFFFETESAAKKFYKDLRYEVYELDGEVFEVDRFEKDEELARTLKMPVNYLDELADPKRLSRNLQHKSLNKLFAFYASNVRRDTQIDDKPEGQFNYHVLMFDKTEGYRGMAALMRRGEMALQTWNGRKIRPDQGLFNHLASRYEADRAAYMADDSIKDKDGHSFDMMWRANALAEFEEYAKACSRTLKDVYDVVTWQMFAYCDKNYLRMDGKTDFLRNSLWRAYKIIFGGMACEAIDNGTEDIVNLDEDLSEELTIEEDCEVECGEEF